MSATHILHKNTNSQMAVALHKRMLRAIAHLGRGGCADIVFYCSGLRPALCRIRTSSGKALTCSLARAQFGVNGSGQKTLPGLVSTVPNKMNW